MKNSGNIHHNKNLQMQSLAENLPIIEMDETLQSESTDSGCVPDSLSLGDHETAEINWQKVMTNLMKEYKFALSLLQHAPGTTAAETKTSAKIDEDKLVNARRAIIENMKKKKNIDNKDANVFQNKTESRIRKEITQKLGKLKRGKIGNLKPQKAKHLESKLKKQLIILDNKKKKKIKKMDRLNRKGEPITKQNRPVYPGILAKAENSNQIYNQCGKIVFSKFDFSNPLSKDKWEENSKKKDLNNQLKKVLKEKEEVRNLEQKGRVQEAAGLLESKVWCNTLKKIHGEKVKDDPVKIAKSIRRQKMQKSKSEKKWKERTYLTQKFKDLREEKKQQNIAKRKQKRMDSKGKGKSKKNKSKGGGKKRKQSVPGF